MRSSLAAPGNDRAPIPARRAALVRRLSGRSTSRALLAVVLLAWPWASTGAAVAQVTAGAVPEAVSTNQAAQDSNARSVPEILATADLSRPRILMGRADIPVVQERLTRQPYRDLLRDIQARIGAAPPPSQADQADCVQTENRSRESQKDRAAMDLSFLYLVDREYDPATATVVEPTPARRQALGDRARDYLRFLCTQSRINVQADRDISTSHELLSAAVAYDDLAGGGYDFAGTEPGIVTNLVALTADFHHGYTSPDDPNGQVAGASRFAVNNHRSKGAASIGVAALVLWGGAGVDGTNTRTWLDFALDRVNLVQDWTYGAGDGGYGEGPFYWRFAMENVVPFAHSWDRISAGATARTATGATVPSLWRSPRFALMQRWLLDTTVPDGTLAPFDDANVGARGFFGLFPADFPGAGALGWRWAHATVPYESEENIDVAPFSIAAFDDAAPSGPPPGSPTRFYPEGGNVIFRSGWGPDATEALVQGEHGAARELGRTRAGTGELWSAAHDHPDPGSLMLYAYGERLLLDPGYMDFAWSRHFVMNKPSDANMVVVQPPGATDPTTTASPVDPFAASAVGPGAGPWSTDPNAPSPADGDATISDTLDTDGLDAATVTARYGSPDGGSGDQSALVRRRLLFVDNRYLIAADDVSSTTAHTYTWPVLGNGGGSAGTFGPLAAAATPPEGAAAIDVTSYAASGGSFEPTASGGRWTRANGRLTSGLAFDSGAPTATARDQFYEQDRKSLAQYTALDTSVSGTDVHAVGVHYPNPTGQAAPQIDRVAVPGGSALRITDVDGDRRVFVLTRATGGARMSLDGALTGVGDVVVTGTVTVVETHNDGSLRSAYTENGTELTVAGRTYLTAPTPSTLDLRLDAGRAEVLLDPGPRPRGEPAGHDTGPDQAASFTVSHLPFPVASADGACSVISGSDLGDFNATVTTACDRRVVLRADGAGGAPAADPGVAQRVAVGTEVVLDASRSCAMTGTTPAGLAPTWTLASAPSGSAWQLTGTGSLAPRLLADRPGPYRVRLTVTDPSGRTSREVEQLVIAGPADADTIDNDLDGRFDRADPDGDGTPGVVTGPPVTGPPVTSPPLIRPPVSAPASPASTGSADGGSGAATESPGTAPAAPAWPASAVTARPTFTG